MSIIMTNMFGFSWPMNLTGGHVVVDISDNPKDDVILNRLKDMPNGCYAVKVCKGCGAYSCCTHGVPDSTEIVSKCHVCS